MAAYSFTIKWTLTTLMVFVCFFIQHVSSSHDPQAQVRETVFVKPQLLGHSLRLLSITSAISCDCLHAKYSYTTVAINATFLLKSSVDTSGAINSQISVTSQSQPSTWDARPAVHALSTLRFVENIHAVVISGISDLVVSAAQITVETIRKLHKEFDLNELVSIYDEMLQGLHDKTHNWPFTLGRSAIYAHSAVIHAAQRLLDGVPAGDVCPPYRGYLEGHGGLFACRQEYEAILKRVIGGGSPLLKQYEIEANNTKLKGNLEDYVEDIARIGACGTYDCRIPECADAVYDLGWNILGSNCGCCADYPSCCIFADITCYFHDLVCFCCTYFICPEPLCVPSPLCKPHTSNVFQTSGQGNK